MREYYVYILLCADGSYYTGVTSDYEARLDSHQRGDYPKAYTCRRRPVKLVYLADFSDIYDAIAWEKRVKRWSRGKKEALILGEWERLHILSFNDRRRVIESIMMSVRYKCCCCTLCRFASCHGEPGRTMTRKQVEP